MSSTYYVLCASHDPATPLDLAEYPTAGEAFQALTIPTARTDRDRETLHLHDDCDLLISCRSGAPVEISCPGGRGPVCSRRHFAPITVEVAWLRLAYAALQHPGILAAAGRLPGCWTHSRIRALRYEIGAVHYPDPDQPDPAGRGTGE